MEATARLVPTRHGPARVLPSSADRPWLTLLLGHGAGGGADAADLTWLAADLPPAGVSVIRIEAPWRVAGKRVAARPPVLDEGWSDVVAGLERDQPGLPVVHGGRSAGARVACRTAAVAGAAGCLALAFPLHPPGRPERTRVGELLGVGVPTLVVQGSGDSFGSLAQFPHPVPPEISYVEIPGADHSMRVSKASGRSAAQTRELLVTAVLGWLTALVQCRT